MDQKRFDTIRVIMKDGKIHPLLHGSRVLRAGEGTRLPPELARRRPGRAGRESRGLLHDRSVRRAADRGPRQGGDVRALSNVCPHRWMLLVGHDPSSTFPFKTESCGNRRSFQCPFHLWSFDLDGKMIGAPGMEQAEDFDKKRWSLPQFPVELWGGFIFVNLDPEAEPLAPQLSTLDPFVEAYELDRLRMLEPLEYDCDWNWKISVEAGSESYHHLGLHQDILEDLHARSDVRDRAFTRSLLALPEPDEGPEPDPDRVPAAGRASPTASARASSWSRSSPTRCSS